jgi:putative membrane protein
VADSLLVIGGINGAETLESLQASGGAMGVPQTISAFVSGAIQWLAAAGVTSSLGRVTDEYLADEFRWRYLNAPFYVVAIAAIFDGLSAYVLGNVSLSYLAAVLTGGTLLGLTSTLAFAVAETRSPGRSKRAADGGHE